MSTFQFNLTHKCNLNCPFCYSFQSKEVMNDQTIDNATEFVINRVLCESNREIQTFSFSGGEVFLGHWQRIPEVISKIKERCPNYRFNFILQSNLTLVDLSNIKYQEVVETVNEFGSSFDAGTNIRFNSDDTLHRFWNNIEYLNSINKPYEIITCITTELIRMYPDPMVMLQGVVNKGIKKLELERLCRPLEERPLLNNVRPTNDVLKEWMVKAYKAYKEIKKAHDLSISTFDCMEDAVNGYYHYEHGRNCQKQYFTVLPNGDVGLCFNNVDKPFYNVNTKELNIDNYELVCKREEIVNPECLVCKYYKHCKGDCCTMIWDSTGCSTPAEIFDLIEEGNK